MAVYPPEEIRNSNPVKAPSALDSCNDKRRVRAYVISILEYCALNGHTVYPVNKLIEDINSLPIEPACQVTNDIINGFAGFLKEELKAIDCTNGEKAYQLNRLFEVDEVIRSSINKRLKGARHEIHEDWRKIVDNAFEGQPKAEFEERARTEKAAILKELAESRLSALIGGAGTGKTTLLALLCKSEQIRNGGVLLLAPTGKARVRMSQEMTEKNDIKIISRIKAIQSLSDIHIREKMEELEDADEARKEKIMRAIEKERKRTREKLDILEKRRNLTYSSSLQGLCVLDVV